MNGPVTRYGPANGGTACDPPPGGLPAPNPDLIERLRAESPSLVEEIFEETTRTVPQVMRLLRGRLATGARPGTDGPAHQRLEKLADVPVSRSEQAVLFRSLGQDAYRQGITLDALQAAFRVGTQIAWRRFARICRDAGASAEQLCLLTEALFAAINEISSDFMTAYTELADRDTDALQADRKRLLSALLSEQRTDVVIELARAARWRPPRAVACVALDEPWHTDHLPPALGPDVLIGLHRPEPCLLVPDPDGPGRLDGLRRSLRGIRHAIGPSVPVREARVSLRLAGRALSLMRRGYLGDANHVRCSEHLPALLVLGDEEVARQLIVRHMAGFADLRPDQRKRLGSTLLTWLTIGGPHSEVAARLSVHPQTVRYRMRQIEGLFGERLQDPEWRYEMLLALQADRLISGAGEAEDERAEDKEESRSATG